MAEAATYLFSREFWLESFWGWFALYPVSFALAGSAILLRRNGWINLGLLNPWVLAFTIPYVTLILALVASRGDLQGYGKYILRFADHILNFELGIAALYFAILWGPLQLGCALLLILNLVENFSGRLFVKPSFYAVSLIITHLLSTFLLLGISSW